MSCAKHHSNIPINLCALSMLMRLPPSVQRRFVFLAENWHTIPQRQSHKKGEKNKNTTKHQGLNLLYLLMMGVEPEDSCEHVVLMMMSIHRRSRRGADRSSARMNLRTTDHLVRFVTD